MVNSYIQNSEWNESNAFDVDAEKSAHHRYLHNPKLTVDVFA